jgi:hypothetical protein
MLIAGIYAIVAWLTFWAKVLDNPSADTIRVLLLIVAAILLALGLVLGRRERPGASDLITVAGIAAILAGAVSLAGLSSGLGTVAGTVSGDNPTPSQGWNVYMLLVSLVLIGFGAKSRTRGPGYVGATGLVIFIGLVGPNVVTRLKGGDFSEITAVVGWPLLLLLVGVAAIIASFAMGDGGGGVGATSGFGQPGPEGGYAAGETTAPGYAGGAAAPGQPAGGTPLPPAEPRPPGAEQPTQQRPVPPPPPGQGG